MWYRNISIGMVVSLVGFVTWPSLPGALLPPLLLLFAWLATMGPSFRYSPRHPDINAVRHTPAMRTALLRPFWTPRHVTRPWLVVLITAGLLPGLIVSFWPVLFADATSVSVARTVWWTLSIPLILSASVFLLEALIEQTVAMPLVGLMIIGALFSLPLLIGGDHRPELRTQRWPITIMVASSAVLALWLVDMLRLLNPHSPRREYLAGKS